MEDDSKIGATIAPGQKTRRAFVKTAAQVAVTAPAVAMLLTASTKAQAAEPVYRNTKSGPGDNSVSVPVDDGPDDGVIFVPGDDFVP